MIDQIGQSLEDHCKEIYYRAGITIHHKALCVKLVNKKSSSWVIKGTTQKYRMWITTNSWFCTCPFIKYQKKDEAVPCKHLLSLADAYLLHTRKQ